MKRRLLLAFVILNVVVSIVVTLTVATLIANSRPEATPIAISPVVVVATPTGPTQTPIIIIVTATDTINPDFDPFGTAEAVAQLTETADPDYTPGAPRTDATPEEPGETPTLSDANLTATEAAVHELTTHTVQSGEFFGAIADLYGVSLADLLCQNNLTDSDFIYPGDVLVIPGPDGCDYEESEDEPTETPTISTPEATATPTPLPTITLPPIAENAQVRITNVLSPGDVTAEEVILTNEGGLIDLKGWTLYDREGNTFTFPDYRLFPGGAVSVRTRQGDNTPIVLYWNQDTAIWGDEGEAVTLVDADENVQSIYIIGEPDNILPTQASEATEEPTEETEEAEEDAATPEASLTPMG